MGNSKVMSAQHFEIKPLPSLPMWLQETYIVIVAASYRSICSPALLHSNDYTNVVLCQRPLASLTLMLHVNGFPQISLTSLSKHKLQKFQCATSVICLQLPLQINRQELFSNSVSSISCSCSPKC